MVIQNPDFSFKGQYDQNALAQAVTRARQQGLQQQELGNSENEQMMKHVSELAQSLISYSAQRQKDQLINHMADIQTRTSTQPTGNTGTASILQQPKVGIGPSNKVQVPVAETKEVPYTSTAEGNAEQLNALAKLNPSEFSKRKIEQLMPLATTQKPANLQTKNILIDGKPAVIDYDPTTGKKYLNGKDVTNEKLEPYINDTYAKVREEYLRNTQTENLGKDLNEIGINSNSPAGISAKRVLYAGSGLNLIHQAESQPGGIDKRQMAELQMEVARVLTGQGVITNEQLNSLATQTAKSKVKNWQEWLTNDPTGLDQQTFVDRFQITLERQQKFHTGELDKYKQKVMAKYTTFESQAPEDFYPALKQAGFDPTEFRKTRKLVPLGDSSTAPEIGELSSRFVTSKQKPLEIGNPVQIGRIKITRIN